MCSSVLDLSPLNLVDFQEAFHSGQICWFLFIFIYYSYLQTQTKNDILLIKAVTHLSQLNYVALDMRLTIDKTCLVFFRSVLICPMIQIVWFLGNPNKESFPEKNNCFFFCESVVKTT